MEKKSVLDGRPNYENMNKDQWREDKEVNAMVLFAEKLET